MSFIWLLFAHYFGDIAFQSSWTSENKGRYWYIMFGHCMVWSGCVSIALEYTGRFSLWKVVFLVVGHWVVDKTKRVLSKGNMDMRCMYIDQALHIIQLGVVYAS